MFGQYNKDEEAERAYDFKEHAVAFANWLQRNFHTNVEEASPTWLDVNYIVHNTRQEHYDTDFLYDYWMENII